MGRGCVGVDEMRYKAIVEKVKFKKHCLCDGCEKSNKVRYIISSAIGATQLCKNCAKELAVDLLK